jgi:CRP-like cAMP-binding protein
LEEARIAVLDWDFTLCAGAFPEITVALQKRALDRVARLSNTMCLAHYRRVETRLLHLFWQLADRFGLVGGDEVRIPLELTHALIAEMAAVRRPSVTSCLTRLDSAGTLRRDEEGWRLLRSSAGQLGSDL